MSDHTEEDPSQEPAGDPPRMQQAYAHGTSTSTSLDADSRPQRRKRLKQLAIVTAIVVAGLVVVFATAGGSILPPKPGSVQATTTEQSITALLAGIPQRANTLGAPTAPITLRWYGDLECPYCRAFTLQALPYIIRHWVRGGVLRIEYLSMETATREPKVFETQQIAALAAGTQNKMWNFIETFYHEQGEEDSGYVTERYLRGLASQVPGLNLSLWGEDRYDPQLAGQVAAERQAAIRARYPGTPTFLIGQTGGVMVRFDRGSLSNPRLFNHAIEYLIRA
jgi:protein-disulfide isomerase